MIDNEFGEVSVDDQLIGDRAPQIKTLTKGCMCSSRSNEPEDALLDLLDNLYKGNFLLATVWSLISPAWPIPDRLLRPFSPMSFYASVTCWMALLRLCSRYMPMSR